MSLNWNLEDIKDHENVCFERRVPQPSEGDVKTDEDGKAEYMAGVTNGLIWATVFVGLHGITETNAAQFAARLELYQNLNGALLVGTDEETGERGPVKITTEDVYQHIGLRCNVTDESDAAWLKRTVTTQYKRSIDRITREQAKAEAAA